jgi:uncharacterized Rmd1/YagE family protein
VDRLTPDRAGVIALTIAQSAAMEYYDVLSVLHLLDKPDAAWDDPGLDRIYADLRAEFDLADRFEALELKLRSVQEALELLLGVARDRRLTALEAVVVFLIVFEIGLAIFRR